MTLLQVLQQQARMHMLGAIQIQIIRDTFLDPLPHVSFGD